MMDITLGVSWEDWGAVIAVPFVGLLNSITFEPGHTRHYLPCKLFLHMVQRVLYYQPVQKEHRKINLSMLVAKTCQLHCIVVSINLKLMSVSFSSKMYSLTIKIKPLLNWSHIFSPIL